MPSDRVLRIAVLSKSDASGGGASRVAEDVVSTLAASGHETVHLVGWSRKAERARFNGGRALSPLTMRLHGIGRRFGVAETVPWELPALLSTLGRFRPDIVHVHDTSTALSPVSLGSVARRYPTFWTFHDCSSFTGGCLYPGLHGCSRYEIACGSCPARGEWPIDGKLDTTSLSLRLKRRLHSSGLVAPVAPSRWMAGLADASGLLVRPTRVIFNCVETDVFKPPANRPALRRKLGLPETGIVFLTSAGNVGDARKGIPDAIEAAKAGGATCLVLLGQPDQRLAPLVAGIETIATGYVSDRSALAEWLGAADAFVFCSKADNQPLGVLEALSCGLPVFSYATGGIPDCVDDTCGGIVQVGDRLGLAGRLSSAAREGALPGMSDAARRRALRDHGPAAFASSHLDAYRAEINSRKPACASPASFTTAAT